MKEDLGRFLVRHFMGTKAFIAYWAFFLVFFSKFHVGVGNFWDWSFPLFSEHIKNYFLIRSFAWNAINQGSPLGYSSDYYFRFVLSLFDFIQPETLLFLFITIICAVTSWFAFDLVRRYGSSTIAILVGLAIIINPAVFYKFVAGHLNFFVSYALFIVLLHYLFVKGVRNLKDAVAIGLLCAFIGTQMQFFFIVAIFFVAYGIFYYKDLTIKYVPVIGVVTVLVNWFWAHSFLISTGIEQASAVARQSSFSSSMHANLAEIFTLQFSKATFLSKYFFTFEPMFYILFFTVVVALFIGQVNKPRITHTIMTFGIVMIFIGTGVIQSITLYPITLFAPVLREVGHFAPVILLSLLLFIGFSYDSSSVFKRRVIAFCLLIMIALTTYHYQSFPSFNFSDMRQRLEGTVTFLESSSTCCGERAMFYPFFAPYSIEGEITLSAGATLLSNSGRDMFSLYGPYSFVNSTVFLSMFSASPQYEILSNLSLAKARMLGVRYIFDFSSMYESVHQKYVPKSYYAGITDKNNDRSFVESLYKENTASMRRIDSGIYEISGIYSRIFSTDAITQLSGLSSTEVFPKDVSVITALEPYVFSDEVSAEGRRDNVLVDVISPFGNLKLAHISTAALVDTFVVDENREVFLHFNKDVEGIVLINSFPVLAASSTRSFSLPAGTHSIVYKNPAYSFQNLIPDGSFETGTWQEKVGDCNRYDDNGLLGMSLNKQEKTDGIQSLQLEATRHIACTNIRVNVSENSTYLLSFDYQSPNAEGAAYYVGFNDPAKTTVSETLPISDTEWQSFSEVIEVPDGATILSLYLYARETDGVTNIINRYDNVSLIEVPDLSDVFYLVSEPILEKPLVEPKSVTFDLINPTKKLVHIKGATTPFFLAMSESYHDQWQLQLNNEKVHGFFDEWWPFAKPDRVADEYHYNLNGFLNGWYVDSTDLCEQKTLCTQNADGSYDIEFVIEFWPQRWFYLGLLISGTTLAGCLGYLGFVGIRRIRRKLYD